MIDLLVNFFRLIEILGVIYYGAVAIGTGLAKPKNTALEEINLPLKIACVMLLIIFGLIPILNIVIGTVLLYTTISDKLED